MRGESTTNDHKADPLGSIVVVPKQPESVRSAFSGKQQSAPHQDAADSEDRGKRYFVVLGVVNLHRPNIDRPV
jgi:hypothetical protein